MRRAALGAAALALALASVAQPPPKKPDPAAPARDAFKGRLKPGLYEMIVEADMGAMPGVPKGQERRTQKVQQCITQQRVDEGVPQDPNCPTRSFAAAGNEVSISAVCKDGTKTETRMTFSPTGYVAEMKASGSYQGQAFNTRQKITSKYLGPCPK